MKRRHSALIGLSIGFVVSSCAFADTITVEQDGSGDYTTITQAVEAVTASDIIEVGPGIYVEGPIYLPGVQFYLESTNGAAETYVLPAAPNAPVFVCDVPTANLPYLTGFTILGANTDSDGGGLRVSGGSQVLVQQCVFEGNHTDGSGGGVWIDSSSRAMITACVFRNNTAGEQGGGLAHFSGDFVWVWYSLFQSNTAGTLGGGASIGDPEADFTGKGQEFTPPLIASCIFLANSAGEEGGGIHIIPTFSQSSPLSGGTIGEGYIDNCTITQNSAPGNGGIAVGLSHQPEWPGGISVRNSISYGNEGASIDYNLETGQPRELPDFLYSCSDNLPEEVESGANGMVGDAEDTNTPFDPRFRDLLGPDGVPGTGDEDLRLMPGSPCIDRGRDTYVEAPEDFEGTARILDDPMTPNQGTKVVFLVDMGAYEFDVTTFHNLDIAFWVKGTWEETPFLAYENWYLMYPYPGFPAYLNGYPYSGDSYIHQKALVTEDIDIGELNITQGSFELYGYSDDIEDPHVVSLYSDFEGTWADLNVGPYYSQPSAGVGFLVQGPKIACDTVTVRYGQMAVRNLRLLGGIVLDSEIAGIGGLGGLTIESIDEEAPPDILNLGYLSIRGGVVTPGSYSQTGTRTDGTPANGTLLSNLLRDVDEQFVIEGTATLAGGAMFNLGSLTPPEPGAQFEIVTANGGFGGTTFDYALTTQSPDGRFVVLSYASGVDGGDSVIATVLSAESLLQGDPAIEAVGVTLADVLLADIDGDGFKDLILSIDMGEGADGSVAVLLNEGVTGGSWNGFESFGGAFSIPVGKQPRGLDVGLIDSDDLLDVVVACYEDGTVVVLENVSDVGPALLATADELVADPALPPTASALPQDVWMGDLDADDDPDLLVTNEFDGSVVCYENVSPLQGFLFGNPLKSTPLWFINKLKPGFGGGARDEGPLGNNEGGNGGAQSGSPNDPVGPGIVMSWTHYDTGADPVDIDAGDLNGDGLIDAVTANQDSDSMSVLLGAGGNTFAPASTFSLGADYVEPISVAIGDFEGDGDLDMVVICTNQLTSERVTVILRNTLDPPSGSYGLVVELEEGLEGLSPYLVRSADVDEDGDDDIVALTETTSLTGDPTYGFATTAVTEEVCVGDFNDSGAVDGADLASVLGAWGTADPTFDLNGSGTVEGADLAILLGAWGPCEGNPPLD